MSETYHSLSELDNSINAKVLSIKKIIDHFRQDRFRSFNPVRHHPLNKIFDQYDYPKDGHSRKNLIAGLKSIGFLEIEGINSGMRYRLKEPDFKRDSELIAAELQDFIFNNRRNKPQKIKHNHPKIENSTELINKNFFSKPVQIKKEYSLGDSAFILHENKIVKGKIISLKYETFSQTSEDYPRIQLPVTVNFNNILCNLLLNDNSVITKSIHDIFDNTDLLLKALQVRYTKNL